MYLTHSERKERLDYKNNNYNTYGQMFCKRCNGNGLDNLQMKDGKAISWDGISYCDECEGWGSVEWIDILIKGLNIDKFTYGKK